MPLVIPVKFAYSSRELWFDPASAGAEEGDHVVCKTERGTEFGLATADPFEVPKSELAAPLKPVLRVASEADIERAEELAQQGEEAIPEFRRLIEKNGLDMKPVAVEYLFGGEKAVFYFAAEDRVDFRQLVKDLSSRFRTRIDMRQIGVRDETRLIGGYAHCGQELCCKRFGGNFEPVSIRMAKEQDLPLNSSKISGMCGRLMCCLRYEFEAYKDFKSRAPKKKAVIQTPLGKAKIVEYDTPKERLKLRLENGKSFSVDLSSMTCSDEACARAKEQGCTCRPDTVTREVLDAIESPDISLALLELDREAGLVPDAGGLSSADRIESSPTPRRRRSSRKEGAESAQQAPKQRSPRRRTSASAAEQGAEGAASREGKRGMQPKRRRRHLSSAEREQAFIDAASKQAGSSEGKRVPEADDASRTTQRADGSKPRRRRHKSASERAQKPQAAGGKPEVPSVAEQVSTGEVRVRRRPGDRGGARAAVDSSTGRAGSDGAARREGAPAQEGDKPEKRRRRRRRPRSSNGGQDANGGAPASGPQGGER